jgi:hypothetical protein
MARLFSRRSTFCILSLACIYVAWTDLLHIKSGSSIMLRSTTQGLYKYAAYSAASDDNGVDKADGRSAQAATQEIVQTGDCRDKGPILSSVMAILKQIRDLFNMTAQVDCDILPNWAEVSSIYGSEPVILGLDSCERYRKILNGTAPRIRIAGLYNSGTNAFARVIDLNVYGVAKFGPMGRPIKNETEFDSVRWGKHAFLHSRGNYTGQPSPTDHFVLPVVIVRDPYRWMESMVSVRACACVCVRVCAERVELQEYMTLCVLLLCNTVPMSII